MLPQELILEKIEGLPPTKLAEVIDFIEFLKERENKVKKIERFQLISQFAQENAGTEFDINENLELASVEFLLASDEK